MHRWVIMAALLLAMGAALPAWADDAADCGSAGTLLKTDPDRAVSACRLLADQGYAGAQYNLGVMYDHGQGVPQNYAEAAKWYRKAADQGYAVAQFNLGVMYNEGQGVPQNYAEATKWYRKAADQGHADAQYNLGFMYDDGQGVPQDYVQAHVWFNLAAAQGDANAAQDRDLMASMMTPAQIEKAQALAAAWKPTTRPVTRARLHRRATLRPALPHPAGATALSVAPSTSGPISRRRRRHPRAISSATVAAARPAASPAARPSDPWPRLILRRARPHNGLTGDDQNGCDEEVAGPFELYPEALLQARRHEEQAHRREEANWVTGSRVSWPSCSAAVCLSRPSAGGSRPLDR